MIPFACTWSYSYDGAGRLAGVSTNLGDGATFGYDGEGKLISQVNQNGTSRSLSYYEPRGWVSSVADRKGTQTIGSYAVQFDGGQNTVGNITRITDHLGQTINYTYDALYRLTGETHSGGSAYQRTYAYDLAGNLTQVNGSSVATYDAANKIATVVGGTVAHDADGNLTAISGPGITPYSNSVFNDFDNLRSFSVNGKSVQYRYDYKGNRTVKIVNGVAESFFIYSGDQLIGEVNPNGTVRAVYTWGAGGLICQRIGADVRYFHYGPQGEVRQVSDSTGNVVGRSRYNAYGVPLEVTGSVSASVRFGGKYGYYTDADSGMIRCGARWYSPELTRWISRDPSGYKGGANLYGYCQQSPTNWYDSDGRESSLIRKILPPVLYEPAIIFAEEKEAHPGPGLQDAIRHAEASRRICERFGESTARSLGILNELLNFKNTWPDAAMDIYNNEVGIEAGKRGMPINLDKLSPSPLR